MVNLLLLYLFIIFYEFPFRALIFDSSIIRDLPLALFLFLFLFIVLLKNKDKKFKLVNFDFLIALYLAYGFFLMMLGLFFTKIEANTLFLNFRNFFFPFFHILFC